MRRRLLQRSLAIFLAFCSPARAAPEIRIEVHGGGFAVQIDTHFDADAALAGPVLTAYNRLADFVPDLRVSRVISAAGSLLQVEQHGRAAFLIFSFAVEVVLEIEETAPVKPAFRAIRDNMRNMHGEWRIGKSAGGIRLVYEAELESSFWVPPLIGPAVLRRDIASQVGGGVREIARRQAELTIQTNTPSGK